MKVKIGKYHKNRNRRIRIRIDKYDTWSADHTLALIIVPLLERYKIENKGYFIIEDEDVPEELRSGLVGFPQKYDDAAEERKYEWVIDKLIWTFRQIRDGWEDQYYSGEIDFHFEETDELDFNGEKLYKMKNGPNHTFQIDHKGIEAHQQEIEAGLKLFAKYYMTLWN